jgi:hypothetical protein
MSNPIDCSVYDDEKCLKAVYYEVGNVSEIIMLACWGVYCQSGERVKFKDKDGKPTPYPLHLGQKLVFDEIRRYVEHNHVSDIYFAGDNVYAYNFDESAKSPKEEPYGFRMDEQLKAFETCYQGIGTRVDRTFIGIGNHDIEDCNILNTQLNYDGWQKTGVYYAIRYKNGLTVVMTDTNMYDSDYTCNRQILYTEKDRTEQEMFVKKVCVEAKERGDWVIVMGHIPAIGNGHKEKNKDIKNKRLYSLIKECKPHLYLCGDEHNQQFIYDSENNISFGIVGSGGTDLDTLHYNKVGSSPIEGTRYAESLFGFVKIKPTEDKLVLDYIGLQGDGFRNMFHTDINRDGSI